MSGDKFENERKRLIELIRYITNEEIEIDNFNFSLDTLISDSNQEPNIKQLKILEKIISSQQDQVRDSMKDTYRNIQMIINDIIKKIHIENKAQGNRKILNLMR